MAWMPDWETLFHFSISPVETVIRGTVMYFLLLLLFRFVARRDIGPLGIADLLIVVIVADAAQNGMAGKGDSVADAALLVGTLIGWNRLVDLVAFYWKPAAWLTNPGRVLLVRDGKLVRENMRRLSITEEELEAKIREHGVESPTRVRRMYLEGDGKISVISD